MRIRFVGSDYLPEYHGYGINLCAGDEAEVRDDLARILLADFPRLFVAAVARPEVRTVDMAAPPVDRQIKAPKRRK